MILGPLIRFATATATKEASVANLINGATIIIYDFRNSKVYFALEEGCSIIGKFVAKEDLS